MITLVACWVLIAFSTVILGHGLLVVVNCDRDDRVGNWLVQTLWLGLIAWGWLAAVVSLVAPVTPGSMALIVGLFCVLALAASGRSLGNRLLQFIRLDMMTALAVLVGCATFVAANLRPTPDTGGYHFPAIRWLAEHGIVTGVAHIQHRFGFVSDLWAMLAPFDTVFDGRVSGVVNGFLLCLVSGQIVLATSRVAHGVARPSDIFLGVASTGILTIGLVIGSFSTPSPDPTVAGLTVVIAWRLLAAGEGKPAVASLVPLLLACGALNAKLSGLLLLPVVGLYALRGANLRRWIVIAIVILAFVAPLFAASVITSGCLAMPASITCLPVPWVLPTESVKELARLLTLFTRWDSQVPPNPGAWDWIPGWLIGTRFWLNAAVFWPFVACLTGFLWVARRDLTRDEIWVLVLLTPSLILMFAAAPEIRYNSGLFVTPIALLAMRLFSPPTGKLMSGVAGIIGAAAAIGMVEVAVSAAIEYRRSGQVSIVERLVLPRAVPTAEYSIVTTPVLQYNVAVTESCWRAPLPCAPYQLKPIVLRAPERGLAGGFQSIR